MIYKALMLDVDGTLIPYDYNALPSSKLSNAIKKAKDHVSVSLVTGRSYSTIKSFLDAFDLKTGYVVTNGGSAVVDLATQELLYEKPIDTSDAKEIVKLLRSVNVDFYLKSDPLNDSFTHGTFEKNAKFKKAYMFFVIETLDHKKVVEIFDKLTNFPNLNLHKTRHADPNKFGFNITHAQATKLHGIKVVMKKLSIKREEIIGVGDSYNDFPLLMASGLKVAMGNAIPELKEVADYIAPPVTEDGVADVIEKFILKS